MCKIVLFNQHLLKINANKSLLIYLELHKEKLIDSPKIYTDYYDYVPNTKIPIYHTFYLREIFNKFYILLDYDDYKYIPSYLQEYCIVISKENQKPVKNIKCYLLMSYNEALKKIRDIL
jgi:hypothetical protein